MTANPRILLVGTGTMGSLHARVLAGSDRCDLVRVAEPREDAGRMIAERYDAQWSPEIGDLSDVDAVVMKLDLRGWAARDAASADDAGVCT